MDERRDPFGLCRPQYREAGIPSHSYDGIGHKSPQDAAYLEEAFYQFEWQINIFYQRASVQSGDGDPLDAITRLRYLLHFHFSLCADKEQFKIGVQLLKGA